MLALEQSDQSPEIQRYSTCNLLKMAFQSQKMQKISTCQLGDGKQKVIYHANLLLPKVKNFIGVQWQVKVTQRLIFIDLQLNSASITSFKLCQFLRNHSQIQQFTHLINNLNLTGRQGYFYFKQITGELILRQKLTNFKLLSSDSVRLKYFIVCIKKISKTFLQEIQQIIFYYRLPGFSLSQVEIILQGNNQVPLQKKAEDIYFLKQSFEFERERKKNSSKQVIKWKKQVPISSYSQILLNFNQSKVATQKQDENRVQKYLHMYKHEIQTILKDITYRKKKETTHIVTGFKIKQVIKETPIGSGGFSQIFHGIYHYLPQVSIYGNSQPPQLTQLDEQEKIIKNSLIKKVSNSVKGEDNISLQNQCNFLIYIRNKVCPYIAQYFCKSQTKQPFCDKQIYLDYYPDNLQNSREKQDKKMKIMEDVCMALLFMNEEKLLHRDLKQANIMIDRYHRAKLIDFGSVANMKGSKNFKERDDLVRSTKDYFRPYKQALKQYPKLKDFMNKDDYYSHQTFDLYSLGVILQNQFYLNQFTSEDHFVRNHLKFLSDKCRQSNPQDRWTIQQVLIFLRHLLLFNQLRKQFWKWGFDPKTRAHQLGKYYNGNGSYRQRIKNEVFQPKSH